MHRAAYVYQADIYCEECGDTICATLKADGKQPEDVMDQSSYDSDDYPKCFDVASNEADSPAYCAICHRFLMNPLTQAGYQYVFETLNAETAHGHFTHDNLGKVLGEWAQYYDFRYYSESDGDDKTGWYSSEMA